MQRSNKPAAARTTFYALAAAFMWSTSAYAADPAIAATVSDMLADDAAGARGPRQAVLPPVQVVNPLPMAMPKPRAEPPTVSAIYGVGNRTTVLLDYEGRRFIYEYEGRPVSSAGSPFQLVSVRDNCVDLTAQRGKSATISACVHIDPIPSARSTSQPMQAQYGSAYMNMPPLPPSIPVAR